MFLRYFLILATIFNVANLSSFAADAAAAPAPQSITITKEGLMGHFTNAEREQFVPIYQDGRAILRFEKEDVKDIDGVSRKVWVHFPGFGHDGKVETLFEEIPNHIVLQDINLLHRNLREVAPRESKYAGGNFFIRIYAR